LARLVRTEYRQVDPIGALPGHQPAEAAATGDEDEAAEGTGQQRTHLAGRLGVVEQHEHPSRRQQRPVERRRLVEVDRHMLRWRAQRVQQGHQRVDGPHGRSRGD
jgi:hypothetical protein